MSTPQGKKWPHKPWEVAGLPAPLYGCHDRDCAAEVSYPASMLRWCDAHDDYRGRPVEAGWYCDNCHMEVHAHPDGEPEDTISLADEIRRRKAVDPTSV